MKKIRCTLSVILSLLMLCTVFAPVALAAECPHSYSVTNVAPTCVEDGYALYVCSLCGDNYKNYDGAIKALGHSYSDWYVLDEATCLNEGHSQRDCSRCGASQIKTVAVIDHVDENSDGACDVCDSEVKVEEVFSPFDWLIAFFKFLRQWFMDIFA